MSYHVNVSLRQLLNLQALLTLNDYAVYNVYAETLMINLVTNQIATKISITSFGATRQEY